MHELETKLTIFQRRIIEKLQQANFRALAELAEYEWSRGRQMHVADSMAIGEPRGELRGEFARANKQAEKPSEKRLDDLRQQG